MADFMMCNVNGCVHGWNCRRLMDKPEKLNQSYMADPIEDCQNKDYQMHKSYVGYSD